MALLMHPTYFDCDLESYNKVSLSQHKFSNHSLKGILNMAISNFKTAKIFVIFIAKVIIK